jgi:hypothetical protein
MAADLQEVAARDSVQTVHTLLESDEAAEGNRRKLRHDVISGLVNLWAEMFCAGDCKRKASEQEWYDISNRVGQYKNSRGNLVTLHVHRSRTGTQRHLRTIFYSITRCENVEVALERCARYVETGEGATSWSNIAGDLPGVLLNHDYPKLHETAVSHGNGEIESLAGGSSRSRLETKKALIKRRKRVSRSGEHGDRSRNTEKGKSSAQPLGLDAEANHGDRSRKSSAELGGLDAEAKTLELLPKELRSQIVSDFHKSGEHETRLRFVDQVIEVQGGNFNALELLPGDHVHLQTAIAILKTQMCQEIADKARCKPAKPLSLSRFNSPELRGGRWKGATILHVESVSSDNVSDHLARRFLIAAKQGQRQYVPPQGSPGDPQNFRNPRLVDGVVSIFAAEVLAQFVDMSKKSSDIDKETVEQYLDKFPLDDKVKGAIFSQFALVFVSFRPILPLGVTPSVLLPKQTHAIFEFNAQTQASRTKEVSTWIAEMDTLVSARHNDCNADDSSATSTGDNNRKRNSPAISPQGSCRASRHLQTPQNEMAKPIALRDVSLQHVDRAITHPGGSSASSSKCSTEAHEKEHAVQVAIQANINRGHLVKQGNVLQVFYKKFNVPLVRVGIVQGVCEIAVTQLREKIMTHKRDSSHGIGDLVDSGSLR